MGHNNYNPLFKGWDKKLRIVKSFELRSIRRTRIFWTHMAEKWQPVLS